MMKITNVLNPIHVYRKRRWIWPNLSRLATDSLDRIGILPRIAAFREASRVLAELKQVREERRLIADRAAAGTGLDIETFDPAAVKNSDTLFILGSGSSINDLSDDDWRLIAAHDSVGFNFWPIHPFVPTYYFYETCEHEDRNALLASLLRSRRVDYSRVVPVRGIRRWLQMSRPREPFDEDWIAQTYFYSAYQIPTNSAAVVRNALRLWGARARARHGSWNRPGILHHRSTADGTLCFGYLCGYRRLVLLGIDLNDSRYFWESEPSRYDPTYFPRNVHEHASSPHAVARTSELGLPVDDYITLFDRLVLKPAGVEVFVGSRQSKLYPRIPLFPEFRTAINS